MPESDKMLNCVLYFWNKQKGTDTIFLRKFTDYPRAVMYRAEEIGRPGEPGIKKSRVNLQWYGL